MTYQLFHGDCLDVLPTLAAGSVDAVICDPPYGTTACKWDSVIPFEPMWRELKRLIKPRGAIVLFGSQPFTSALVMSNPKWFRYSLVWHKRNRLTGHGNANKMPMRAHEDIVIFYKALPTFNPQKAQGKPYKRPRGYAGEYLGKTKLHDFMTISSGGRFPTSVLEINDSNSERGLHPNQKPLALMEYLVKTYTNEGSTVLDFTMGSGTTGAAAGNLNRRFIGIERDAGYFATAEARIAAAYAPLAHMERAS